MLASLKLILPALAPSWRFFASVGPSPRLEFALASHPQDPGVWRELRPRPATTTWREMLRRLLWNPDGAERLFLTSCAERWLEAPTEHSRREIVARILADLAPDAPAWLRWRIVLLSRRDARLAREVAYVSPAWRPAPR